MNYVQNLIIARFLSRKNNYAIENDFIQTIPGSKRPY